MHVLLTGGFVLKLGQYRKGRAPAPPRALSSLLACLVWTDCNHAEMVLPPSGQAQLLAMWPENGTQANSSPPCPFHPQPQKAEKCLIFKTPSLGSILSP